MIQIYTYVDCPTSLQTKTCDFYLLPGLSVFMFLWNPLEVWPDCLAFIICMGIRLPFARVAYTCSHCLKIKADNLTFSFQALRKLTRARSHTHTLEAQAINLTFSIKGRMSNTWKWILQLGHCEPHTCRFHNLAYTAPARVTSVL